MGSTYLYIKPMRERKRGAIINVASTAAFQPVPYMATYAATKAFVLSFSEALWDENRAHGIHVMALCPGVTETNFFAAAETDKPPMRVAQTPGAGRRNGAQRLEAGQGPHHFRLDELPDGRIRAARSALGRRAHRRQGDATEVWKNSDSVTGKA